MSNILPLPSSPPRPAADTKARQAARCWGQRLAWLLGGLLGIGTAFAVALLTLGLVFEGAFLWLAPGAAYLGHAPTDVPGLVPFGDLPRPTRWAYAATFALDTTPVLAILVELRRLALAYAAGIAFSADAVKRLRRVGLWLVGYALAPAVGHGLVLLAGHGVDMAWLHASSFEAFVLAALAGAIAAVVREGHAIQLDRDGFV